MKAKRINHLFQKLLILLFIISFILALIRLGFNYIRAFTVERKWMQYTIEQKREELYGNIYAVLEYVNKYFPSEDNILLISQDGKQYFIVRYILYPRKVFWDKLDTSIRKKTHVYSLIIEFNPIETRRNYPLNFFELLARNREIIEIKKNNEIIANIYK